MKDIQQLIDWINHVGTVFIVVSVILMIFNQVFIQLKKSSLLNKGGKAITVLNKLRDSIVMTVLFGTLLYSFLFYK